MASRGFVVSLEIVSKTNMFVWRAEFSPDNQPLASCVPYK